MRHRLFIAVVLGVPFAGGGFLACGVPSSFEHLVGTPVEAGAPDVAVGPPVADSTLKPPRQVAPLAASYINSTKPHFRWQLEPNTIGAIVDVCDTRDCSGTKKTYTATGADFTMPDDLPLGTWFWRLTSTTSGSVGTMTSPVWPLLVRGGPANGDARGSIADLNGDGIGDLIFTTVGPPVTGFGGTATTTALGNNPNDRTSFDTTPTDYQQSFTPVSASAMYAAADFDGDGCSDVLIGDRNPQSAGGPDIAYIEVIGGSSATDGGTAFGGLSVNNFYAPMVPPLDVSPAIAGGGDFDGDGYADAIVSQRTSAFALYGSPNGLSVLAYFDNLSYLGFSDSADAGYLPAPTNPIAVFSVDQDLDGIDDVLEESDYVAVPFYVLKGASDRSLTDTALNFTNNPLPDRATAFAAGDLDADGKPDIAFVTAIASKPSVCVILGSADLNNGTFICWTPTTPATGFGSSIVAADLDGDGKDELLVGATSGGVDVVSLANNALTADHLAIAWGAELTVVFPGRPGPAVWAATEPSGAAIGIFKNKDPTGQLMPPEGTTAFGAGIR